MATADLFDIASYDYDLPEELIAQNPVVPRDSSRLLLLDRHTGAMRHALFSEIVNFLDSSDLLVLNDTKVIPARLRGRKLPGGGKAEILLLKPLNSGWNEWEALVKPGRRLRDGTGIQLSDGTVVTVGERLEEGVRRIFFPAEKEVLPLLGEIGETPLPPYITRSTAPASSYQTVFAAKDGSAAAPTASLHFTEELLRDLRETTGVSIGWLTLHVGLGTFRPVQSSDIRAHSIHEEYCFLPLETKRLVEETKRRGGRVIAAGTTVARTLESMATGEEEMLWGEMNTRLFIFPGYRYRVIDGLITNFHLPKSSLLMLVSAFAGYDATMRAYETAVAMKYRFFSFGDAMFIR
jgi:S-adenosylmethionine:tRNA ribosyltransferase-isomerase